MTEPTPVVVYRPSQTVKVLLAVAVLLMAVALLASIYSSAGVVRDLSGAIATKNAKDACYDQYTADIQDGNAETLASLVAASAARAANDAALDRLVVLVVAMPRDPAAIADAVRVIDEVAVSAVEVDARASKASSDYDAAVKARNDYVNAGRPLPCTNDPN